MSNIKDILKDKFKTGEIPNGADFALFIDAFIASINETTPDSEGNVNTDYHIIGVIGPDQPPSVYPEGSSEFYSLYDPNDYAAYIAAHPDMNQLKAGDICVRTFRGNMTGGATFAYQTVDNVRNGVFEAAFVRIAEDPTSWGPLTAVVEGSAVVGYDYAVYRHTVTQAEGHVTQFDIDVPNFREGKDILMPFAYIEDLTKDDWSYTYVDPTMSVTLNAPYYIDYQNPFVLQVLHQKPQSLIPIGDGSATEKGIVQVDGTTITATNGVISAVGGGGSTIDVIDNLTSTSSTDALAAGQGKVLKDDLDTHEGLVASDEYLGHVKVDGTTIVADADGVISAVSGGGSGATPVLDNLTSTSTTSALSANQGRVLKGLVDAAENDFILYSGDYALIPSEYVKDGVYYAEKVTGATKVNWLAAVNYVFGTSYTINDFELSVTTRVQYPTYIQEASITLAGGNNTLHGVQPASAHFVRVATGPSAWSTSTKGYSIMSGSVDPNAAPVFGFQGNLYFKYDTGQMFKLTNAAAEWNATTNKWIELYNEVDVVNNLTSTDTDKALSAAQGKALNDAITALPANVARIQSFTKAITPVNFPNGYTMCIDFSTADLTTWITEINSVCGWNVGANDVRIMGEVIRDGGARMVIHIHDNVDDPAELNREPIGQIVYSKHADGDFWNNGHFIPYIRTGVVAPDTKESAIYGSIYYDKLKGVMYQCNDATVTNFTLATGKWKPLGVNSIMGVTVDPADGTAMLPSGNTTGAGIVQLSNAIDGTSQTVAATEKAVSDAVYHNTVLLDTHKTTLATDSVIGHVKSDGHTINIDEDGAISVDVSKLRIQNVMHDTTINEGYKYGAVTMDEEVYDQYTWTLYDNGLLMNNSAYVINYSAGSLAIALIDNSPHGGTYTVVGQKVVAFN